MNRFKNLLLISLFAIGTNAQSIDKVEAIKKQGNHIRGDGGSDTYYMKGLNFKLKGYSIRN